MPLVQCLVILCVAMPLAGMDGKPTGGDLVQQGFNDMYNLSFAKAHSAFEAWEKVNPENPEGPVFDAAAYLFSEFNRMKILQAQFFVNDRSYERLKPERQSAAIKSQFEKALAQSRSLADKRLQRSPRDRSALFANVLSQGLRADYLALIEKQNLSALKEIKQATRAADNLLKIYPDCYDAYIASGIENYLLSLKPAPVRWLLQATGAQADRQAGIAQLRITAAKGEYLQPYAELLLALAALRDNNVAEARRSLIDLAKRFPQNPLYREELAKIH